MEQAQIRSFVEQYLHATDCQIIESNEDMIDVQLSIKADQDLLNRPFYWMYVEKMNLPAHPVQFRFFFTETDESKKLYSDHLFFGSPRFTQMLHAAQKHGRFVRLYQQPKSNNYLWDQSKGYDPYLVIHYRISYICDQKKDRISYLAIDLQSGKMDEAFYSWAQKQQWTHRLPPSRYLKPTHLTLTEAVGRCEAYLEKQIEQEDHSWAEEARARLNEECRQIEFYYPEEEPLTEDKREEKKQRLRETTWQYQPRIEIDVINAGLFYLEPSI